MITYPVFEAVHREMRALLKASKEMMCEKLIILNNDAEKEEIFQWFGDTVKIQFIPLWKWLIECE